MGKKNLMWPFKKKEAPPEEIISEPTYLLLEYIKNTEMLDLSVHYLVYAEEPLIEIKFSPDSPILWVNISYNCVTTSVSKRAIFNKTEIKLLAKHCIVENKRRWEITQQAERTTNRQTLTDTLTKAKENSNATTNE